jgi:hypothetical protein
MTYFAGRGTDNFLNSKDKDYLVQPWHLFLPCLVVYLGQNLIFRTGNMPYIANSSGISGMASGSKATMISTHPSIQVGLNLFRFETSFMSAPCLQLANHVAAPLLNNHDYHSMQVLALRDNNLC